LFTSCKKGESMTNRKRGQILDCQYGFHWPLNLHTNGYVYIVDSDSLSYIWWPTRPFLETLQSVNA
jgi:hypothetical protein